MDDPRISERQSADAERERCWREQRSALKRIDRAQRAREKAERAYHDAVREWHASIAAGLEAGISAPMLAERLGLSKQRVYQLAKESKEER